MTPTPRFRTLTLRTAQVGLLSGLGVVAAALTLPASALPSASAAPAPQTASHVQAQTASEPVTVARPTTPRADRARALAPKHLPMKKVVRTVAVGRTFSGQASWYGGSFNGRRTANGERFDTNALTAASKTLPFGTRLRVCHDGCVVVRINDRGPYVSGRILDLSRAAATAIGNTGVAHVTATPVAQRTVSVVDTAALARQQAHERHAAAVARSHKLRAIQLAQAAAARTAALKAAAEPARQPAPEAPRTPIAAGGGLLALASGGVLRRSRP